MSTNLDKVYYPVLYVWSFARPGLHINIVQSNFYFFILFSFFSFIPADNNPSITSVLYASRSLFQVTIFFLSLKLIKKFIIYHLLLFFFFQLAEQLANGGESGRQRGDERLVVLLG